MSLSPWVWFLSWCTGIQTPDCAAQHASPCFGSVESHVMQGCGSAFISSGSGSSILGWIPIRIQSGSRALMTKNWKKITADKKFNFVGSKTIIYLYLGLLKERPGTEEAFSSQRRPSNTSKHELKKIFLLLWVIFALLDPDILTQLNPDPIRIRIRIRNPDVMCRKNWTRPWRSSAGWRKRRRQR